MNQVLTKAVPRILLLSSLISLSEPTTRATDNTVFDLALARSGYIHSPLQYKDGMPLEKEADAKPVLFSKELHGADVPGDWTPSGSTSRLDLTDEGIVELHVNFDTGSRRVTGSPDDPDYGIYDHAAAVLNLNGISLDDCNRIFLIIEPRCPGLRVVNINLLFNNRIIVGKGFNPPTGAHLIQLENNRLNRCYLEIGDLRRDCVDNITLSVSVNGRDLPSAGDALFRIHTVAAQKVENTEKVSGWQPQSDRIVYSQTGYAVDDAKTAVCSSMHAGSTYVITDTCGNRTVAAGKVRRTVSTTGEYGIIDFSGIQAPGYYRIEIENGPKSAPFRIDGPGLWDISCWKVLNFIFCQRCGYPVPGVHSLCHTDLFSVHDGQRRSYAGGWHDAGDLSQQTLQTADVSFSLLELYDAVKYRNPVLGARLREEALWGIDFVLRNRMGDGYHASSMGLLIWQDGIIGSHDDIESVRVQNLPFDNFLYSAYEAYAARVLDDGSDPMLVEYLGKIAAEDYEFARSQFLRTGFGGWISVYEHTYCTSESQFMATASWAASQLYALTGDDKYAAQAREYAGYVLGCQHDGQVGRLGIGGFFYRNPEKKSVVHFIHQSREQVYMQAFSELCRTQQNHPDYGRWMKAISAYGQYLKSLMTFTAPYGMIPAGIYRHDEFEDSDAFYAVHLFPPANACELFRAQAAHGIDAGDGYFVKRFPVWFNIFNGNLAVHTSMGKAAAICANVLHDRELQQIAREQLYWIVGKNPFAQSLIYGEGARYSSLNNFSSGELTGAMPVGIRSLGDSDEPYWPQINNACYKEVWLTSAGKWLSLVAETTNDTTNID